MAKRFMLVICRRWGKWKILLLCNQKINIGYTKTQLKINYTKKTYKVGDFKIGADKTTTQKEIERKIEELKKIGFKEE